MANAMVYNIVSFILFLNHLFFVWWFIGAKIGIMFYFCKNNEIFLLFLLIQTK